MLSSSIETQTQKQKESMIKRFHVHISVDDLDANVRFYSNVFGTPPTVLKTDYAKWMLEDPRVNFAISQRGARTPGIDHIGVQVDSRPELDELAGRLKAAGEQTFDEEAVNCCYAQGDKSWVNDPSGVRWETFYTFGESTTYGEADTLVEGATAGTACCGSSAGKPEKAIAGGCCG